MNSYGGIILLLNFYTLIRKQPEPKVHELINFYTVTGKQPEPKYMNPYGGILILCH